MKFRSDRETFYQHSKTRSTRNVTMIQNLITIWKNKRKQLMIIKSNNLIHITFNVVIQCFRLKEKLLVDLGRIQLNALDLRVIFQ